jgi:hypothetical protein
MAVVAVEREWEPNRVPRRDAAARARLAEVAGRARPAVTAGDRLLPVPGGLGEAFPGGGLRRGSVITVGGAAGTGATTVMLALASAVTAAGEWAAIVDPRGTLGGRAAAEAGAALERLAVVRKVPPGKWPTVVAALLDGFALVAAEVPAHCRLGDARRLAARARERAATLVALGAWPAEAAVRLHTTAAPWSGLGNGDGLLLARDLNVRVEHRGAPVDARLRAG